MAGVSDDRALWIARHILPHEPALRAQLGRWRLPGDLDADDVVQEAYSRFASMESVADVRNPRAYLFSIARTIVLMHLRHARVISIRAMDDNDALTLAISEPSPEVQTSDREQLHLLAMAVAELPEPGRSAFLMRVIDELPHRAIGERLGISDNAVQKSVTKSLVKLMAILGRGGKDNPGASRERQRKTKERKERDAGTRDERRD